MGNLSLIKVATREKWGGLRLENLLEGMHYAFRQIGRSPGFAAVVIGTLALGIGAAQPCSRCSTPAAGTGAL